MELKCKRSLSDLLTAYQTMSLKSPINYFIHVTMCRVIFPVYIITYYLISLFFFQDEMGTILITLLIFISVWILILIGLKLYLQYLAKLVIARDVKKKPYLVEEQLIQIHHKSIYVTYIKSQIQGTHQIGYLIEKDRKYYLYDERKRNVAIIPMGLFKSEEEKKLFLDRLDIRLEVFKASFLEWGLH